MSIETIKTRAAPFVDEATVAQRREALERRRAKWAAARRVLSLYLDDLLTVAGVCCLTAAAGLHWGAPAALAAAGCGMIAYAAVIARARKW